MILSMTFQCRLFFISAALGAAGGFIYTVISCTDIYRRRKIIRYALDMIYWLMFAMAVFLCMLCVNRGEIRPFSILGIALGMIIYHMTLDRYMRNILTFIYKIASKLLSTLIEIVLTPIKLLMFPLKKILFNVKKLAKSSKV